jgi:senataxin
MSTCVDIMLGESILTIRSPPGTGKTGTIISLVGALLTPVLQAAAPQPSRLIQGQRGEAPPPPKKLLVCAPSNAAVDELVMRLKKGVKTTPGVHKSLNVVRLGRSDAVNNAVLDNTLDELVAKKLDTSGGGQGPNIREQVQKAMSEHQEVSKQLREAFDQLHAGTTNGEALQKLNESITQLKSKKQSLSNMIEDGRDKESKQSRNAELSRKRAQQEVLDQAHVICATLSGSGHDMFQSLNIEFETVIIDEAAQCVELSALIPLKYGCAKCILVGDPKQLPPTVLSKQAAKFQYEQSLFVRMQTNRPKDVHLLDTQYRMHPAISAFPSSTFYDARLLDGPDMGPMRRRPWHANGMLGPYRFFDVQGQHQAAPKGHSLINLAEIKAAMTLYTYLTQTFISGSELRGKIGIITPYKSQLRELKDRFSAKFGGSVLDAVDFNTTDAFQGREAEIIIFSCVRASPAGGIGFLQDIRRMNVGLTRAKSSLWVLGNSDSLSRGEFWKKLIDDARARGLHSEGEVGQLLKRAPKVDVNFDPMWAANAGNSSVKKEGESPVNSSGATKVAGDEKPEMRRASESEAGEPASVKNEHGKRGLKMEDSDTDMVDAPEIPQPHRHLKKEPGKEVKRETKSPSVGSNPGAAPVKEKKPSPPSASASNGRPTPPGSNNGNPPVKKNPLPPRKKQKANPFMPQQPRRK